MTSSIARLRADRRARAAALAVYYLAIQAGLFLLYGASGFEAPPFIYQAF
ncbi:MAG: hypothetical protein M3373_02465 [Gemmatimonadota bacterium]|nr:hypothetical protein [Gemmatimonadota bacterium]